ncbi:MAG: glycerol-3-phosphate dehydrogenase [Pseudomonadota bacterium]
MGLTKLGTADSDRFANLAAQTFDLVVVGGGVNGAGIARDAAGRGLKVLLCERDDFAQHTSSASTKLIHGGLRYLEFYDFKLVRHSLLEREALIKIAPHIIWPMRFVLPHHKGLRPKWMIRLGLFIYDHLVWHRSLPKTKQVNLLTHDVGRELSGDFTYGFEYSDCWVQDARLVVLNAMDAASKGATVLSRTACIGLSRENNEWTVSLQDFDRDNGETIRIKAKAVVNAAGPWVDGVAGQVSDLSNRASVRLVRGSHIIVPRQFEHEQPYIFQNADNRILFAIPFETDYTLIGTTDVEVDIANVRDGISEQEIDYLCDAFNAYVKQSIGRDDIVWTYAGVRPLFDDASKQASKVTRDYVLVEDTDGAPIISVYGGKVTTYRKLAEDVMDSLRKLDAFKFADLPNSWTQHEVLPGGDMSTSLHQCVSDAQSRFPELDAAMVARYVRHYGTRVDKILTDRCTVQSLGVHFGADLYQAEVDYLMYNEYARKAEDILWRRTKLGLKMTPENIKTLSDYMSARNVETTE